MSLSGMSWTAKYGDVQLALRQRGTRDFQIAVGDGTLTHFHPARNCDLNSAKLQAYHHAVRFTRFRPRGGDAPADQVVTLEWEAIESAEERGPESDVPCGQDANTMSSPKPSG